MYVFLSIIHALRSFLTTPALLLGLVTFLGLVLQKKKPDQIIKGTVTTVVGFLVLTAGSVFLQNGALRDFGILFNSDFHIRGIIPNVEAASAAGMERFGAEISIVMCLGMLANLVIAKYSPLHYIFLTGHHILYMACLLVVVLYAGGLRGAVLILSGSLLLGFLMAAMPAAAAPVVRRITGKDRMALGHFSTLGYLFAAYAARIVTAGDRRRGRKIRSTEDLSLSRNLSFMRDSTVSIALVMTTMFVVITGIAASQGTLPSLETGYAAGGYDNWFIYALVCGAEFSAGIYIILAGVRMVIAEILPAFKGIAASLVPHARPAIDCPALFAYAPNAVMIGFLMSFAGGIAVFLIMIRVNATAGHEMLAIIVPGVVAHFFCGGTAGVFANSEGGIKGCVIGSFLHGILLSLLSFLVLPVQGVLSSSGTAFSDTDFCAVGIVLGNLAPVLGAAGLTALSLLCFLLPVIYQSAAHRIRPR